MLLLVTACATLDTSLGPIIRSSPQKSANAELNLDYRDDPEELGDLGVMKHD